MTQNYPQMAQIWRPDLRTFSAIFFAVPQTFLLLECMSSPSPSSFTILAGWGDTFPSLARLNRQSVEVEKQSPDDYAYFYDYDYHYNYHDYHDHYYDDDFIIVMMMIIMMQS